ncbi:MAG: VCBS repeat-containing protein [Pelobacteraceae bacterium]
MKLLTMLLLLFCLVGCGGMGGGSSTDGIALSNIVLTPSEAGKLYVSFQFSSIGEAPTYVHAIVRDTERKILSDTISPIGGNKNLSGLISGTATLSELLPGDYEIEFSLKTDSGKTSNLLFGKFTAQWSLGQWINYPLQNISSAYSDTSIGDLNSDGRNDIIVNCRYIYYQNSSGGFNAPVDLGITYWSGVKIADMDNDGRDDLVVAGKNSSWGTIMIYYQDSAGKLLPPVNYQLDSTEIGRLTVADLDNDGLNDIVVMTGTPYGESHVTILFQKPDGSFEPEVTYKNVGTRYFVQIFVADINGDGKKDLIFKSSDKDIKIMQQTAWRTFVPYQILSGDGTSNAIGAIAVGDVDGDGRSDIVATITPSSTYDSSGTMVIYFQSSNGGFGVPIVRQEHLTGGVRIADINQDGLNDIVCDTYGGLLVVLQRSDHSLDTSKSFYINNGTPERNEGLSIGDITGDGRLDAVMTLGYAGMYVLPYAPAFRIN